MKRNSFLRLSSVFILLVIAGHAFGQDSLELRNRRVSLKMKQQPVGKVLTYLMQKYQISIGFEESSLDRGQRKFDFYANIPTDLDEITSDGPLDDDITEPNSNVCLVTVDVEKKELWEVLDSITSQMQNYRWDINDDVVNIFPSKGRDSRIESLLNTNISQFISLPDDTVFAVSSRLSVLPEFRNWLVTNKIRYSPFREGPLYQLDDQYHKRGVPHGINFTNISFRKLLNEITRAKGGGWRLLLPEVRKNGDQYLDLDI